MPAPGSFRSLIYLSSRSWESIANGAVRCEAIGIGKIVSLRIARFNVGMVYDTVWDEHRDFDVPERKYVSDFTGAVMVSHRMKWYLRRVSLPVESRICHYLATLADPLIQGERIQPGFQVDFPITLDFYDYQWRGKTEFALTAELMQSSEDDAPSRTTAREYTLLIMCIDY
jgi:hypothetical protein